MKKRNLILIIMVSVILCVLLWYNSPFSYSFGEDVEFNVSVGGKFIRIESKEQREALIKLAEDLKMRRSMLGVGNIQANDYIFLRANDTSHPYLGFHLSMQDISVEHGARSYSADTDGNKILNPQGLIEYLDSLIIVSR